MSKQWNRVFLLAIPVLIALVFSAFTVTPVLADDSVPPPADPAVVDPPPVETTGTDGTADDPAPAEEPTVVEESAPVEEPVVMEGPVPTAEPVVAEEPAPAEEPVVVEEPAPAEETVAETVTEVLEQLPEGTEVVVTDATGEVLPLATAEAAEVLVEGDPMWCPTGVTPGGAGCTAPMPTFTQLLPFITDKTVAGTIWIASNYNSVLDGTSVTLDGTLGTTVNYALTLQGGWSGTLGSAAINTSSPSIFNIPLTISGWNANVTLNDILVTAVTGGNALTVNTTKDITLNRVEVRDNTTGGGANLNNSGGAGKVTVTSSKFNNNAGGRGLDVASKGAITLNNVIANGNGSHAAYLDNSTAPTAQPVTLSGTNTFTGNFYGLDIESKGAITLNNVTASSNPNGYGAYLKNDYATVPQNVTLTGTNVFNSNFGGLIVYSKGVITLNNVTANLNTSNSGAWLDNTAGTAAVSVNSSQFNNNSNNNGLGVVSNGVITLNNVAAGSNGGIGSALYNNYAGSSSGIAVTGTNTFTGNTTYGLVAYSFGTIALNNVTASNNGQHGAYLNNSSAATAKTVTIANSTFNGNAQTANAANTDMGLVVRSKGAITISNLTANFNGNADADGNDGGVWLENTWGTAGVTLTGANFVSDNERGLYIYTNGAVLLNNLVNNGNYAGDGAFIDNCAWNGTACASTAAVSILGANEFKLNGRGLYVNTGGAITLNNVTATFNNWTCSQCGGAYLWNANSSTSAGVTLTGVNIFKDNSMTGLQVYSKGVVTLNNVTASYNGWYDSGGDEYYGNGAFIDNTYATTPKAVSLLGNNTFLGNATDGLVVFSKGAIKVNNLFASFNGRYDDPVGGGADTDGPDTAHGDGAYLDNCALNNNGTPGDDLDDFCTSPLTSTITLTGANTFNGNNWGIGLHASSLGAISVSNLNAHNNGSFGAMLDNNWVYKLAGVYKLPYTGVTLSGYGNASNNGNNGIGIYSTGIVTTNNLTAENNGNFGVRIYNGADAAMPKAVTLNGTNIFNNNVSHGLSLTSLGVVTVNNIDARGNGGDGVLIANCGWDGTSCTASVTSAVSLNGLNTFQGNGLNGLEVHSKGAITTNNMSSSDNAWVGAFLDNQETGATGAIAVKNTSTFSPEFARNGYEGLVILSNGNITVMDLDAYENGGQQDPLSGHGVYLDNASGGGTGNVSLGTSRANWFNGLGNNFLSGLEVYSNGSVTLSNVRANNNGGDNGADTPYGYGVYIANDTASAPKNVTLLGTNNFHGNASGGLYIFSKGAIALSNVNANNNGHRAQGGDGAQLNNSGAVTPQPVTLTGNNSFYNNYNNGLQVDSKGAITVSNLTSNDNGDGAELDNTHSGTTSPQNVTLNGFGDFYNNYNNGLEILSYGAITTNNLNTDGNGQPSFEDPSNPTPYGFGAYLDNSGGTLPRAVTLNGQNNFSNNLDGGLEVQSLGVIKVNSVDANSNNFGILLNNNKPGASGGVTITGGVWTSDNDTFGMDVASKGAISINVGDAWVGNNGTYGWNLDNHFSGAVGGITLSSPNTNWAFDFWRNGTYGLWVRSLGAISVTGLDSSENGSFGAQLDNAFSGSVGTITITVPTAGNNDFSGNVGDGLLVYSNRAITVGSLNSNNNGGAGAVLDNSLSGAASPQNVTVTKNNDFHNNGDTGLLVLSYGAIALNNLNVSDNGQNNYYAAANSLPIDPNTGWGVYAANCFISGSDCVGVPAKGITLSGVNNIYHNFQDGLFARSLGAISASKIESSDNGGDGAYLDNQWDVKHSNVTVTGYGNFFNNGSDGLVVYSNGSVSLVNMTVIGNGGGGAYIDAVDYNPAPLGGPANVTILGTNYFENNRGGDGLNVTSDGVITLNNINANWNSGRGAYLDNISTGWWTPLPAVRLNLTGVNTFNGNGGNGLEFLAYGNVSMTKVTADRNGGNGVWGNTTNGNITLACGSMNANGGRGYDLTASGKITLSGVNGYSNFAANSATAPTVIVNRACPLP